jgi:hypothetical protein
MQAQQPTTLASDEERAKMVAQAEANAKTACLATIVNPGKRMQVIYDGIYNSLAIKFDPGETKTIRIAAHMVARVQDDEKLTDDPENPNLRVLDWKEAPPEVPAAAQPPRKPRPVRAA